MLFFVRSARVFTDLLFHICSTYTHIHRMLFQSRRSATIRTLNFCETLFLRRESYLDVAAHFPKYAKKVRKTAIKVMWRNMLTSSTLKQALVNAAKARELELERLSRRASAVDMASQMQLIMGAMTERLREYEVLAAQAKRVEAAVDRPSGGSEGMEALEEENKELRRRLSAHELLTDSG